MGIAKLETAEVANAMTKDRKSDILHKQERILKMLADMMRSDYIRESGIEDQNVVIEVRASHGTHVVGWRSREVAFDRERIVIDLCLAPTATACEDRIILIGTC